MVKFGGTFFFWISKCNMQFKERTAYLKNNEGIGTKKNRLGWQ
jgi:hypothetical protein